MEDHFEHKYNREYESIEQLVEAAIYFEIIKKEDKDVYLSYLRDTLKDDYFYQPTDIRFDENTYGITVRIPFTLRALNGLLQQRRDEIQFFKALFQEPIETDTFQLPTIPENLLNKLENAGLITKNPLQWDKNQLSLCAYFIDSLFQKTHPNNLWKLGENLFHVKNLRQAKYRYSGNKKDEGKPKNYQLIDRILKVNT